jgi:hypothetical protein
MEPNFKLVLDELAKLNHRFDEQDQRWSQRFFDLECAASPSVRHPPPPASTP